MDWEDYKALRRVAWDSMSIYGVCSPETTAVYAAIDVIHHVYGDDYRLRYEREMAKQGQIGPLV